MRNAAPMLAGMKAIVVTTLFQAYSTHANIFHHPQEFGSPAGRESGVLYIPALISSDITSFSSCVHKARVFLHVSLKSLRVHEVVPLTSSLILRHSTPAPTY